MGLGKEYENPKSFMILTKRNTVELFDPLGLKVDLACL